MPVNLTVGSDIGPLFLAKSKPGPFIFILSDEIFVILEIVFQMIKAWVQKVFFVSLARSLFWHLSEV